MTPDTLPPALLLDLDDTILDDSLGMAMWGRVVMRYASEVAPISASDLTAAIQRSRDWYWSDSERYRAGVLALDVARQTIVTTALIELGMEGRDDLAQRIATDYSAMRDAAMRPLPGALDTLARLRKRGVRMGLITNGAGEAQRRKVERFGLAQWFEVIVIEGEFGCGKPDERVYHHALAALQAIPESAWMVGDNLENDVLAPQRLGVTGIWVNPTGRALPPDAPERPSRVIRALAELV
ncbi:MAG TPA: HAD family hydrolase [Ktedonobacterales bacterium]|nr:HAD family hydrolase [Ktedonobacterales bacterium]